MPQFKASYFGYLRNMLILIDSVQNFSNVRHVITATIRANLDQEPRNQISYINYFVLTMPDLFQFNED